MKRIFLPVKEMFHIHGHDMRGALSEGDDGTGHGSHHITDRGV